MNISSSLRNRCGAAPWAIGALAVLSTFCVTVPAQAQTLERIQQSSRIRLGFLPDARPFSYRSDGGSPQGYSVELCQQIAARVKKQLQLQELTVEWVPVTLEDRVRQVEQGQVDLLCAPTSVTLDRRKEVSFSIPVFAAGNRIVLRADAPTALREALSENPTVRPVWRGSPATKVLEGTSFAVVKGTTTEKWLAQRRAALQVDADIVPVADLKTAIQRLLDHKVDAIVTDRTALLGALDPSDKSKVIVLDRLLTHEQAAFALARGDEDFRLFVDGALSEIYASVTFPEMYGKWFGQLEASARSFFAWTALSQ